MGSWPGSGTWATGGRGVWGSREPSVPEGSEPRAGALFGGEGVRVGTAYLQAFAVIARLAHSLEPSSNRKRR